MMNYDDMTPEQAYEAAVYQLTQASQNERELRPAPNADYINNRLSNDPRFITCFVTRLSGSGGVWNIRVLFDEYGVAKVLNLEAERAAPQDHINAVCEAISAHQDIDGLSDENR